MNTHKVELNYIIIEDDKGRDVLRFFTVEEYENFLGGLYKYAIEDFYEELLNFTTFYNVDIDGILGFDLTSNQYYDGEDIELNDGTYINI